MGETAYFAADVSKDELTIARVGDRGLQHVVNSVGSIAGWLDGLPRASVVAMEATGSYHRLLAQMAYARGMVVYVVNPRDFYHYARGVGARAKTDPVDARLLARYIANEHAHLPRFVPAPPDCEHVLLLLKRRAVAVRSRQTLRQSLAELPELDGAKQKALDAISGLIDAIDAQIKALNHEQRSAPPKLVRRLQSIPGVGPLVGSLLAALLRRFDFRSADSLIAYVGMDPRPDESGQHRGRRRLSKRGHPEWRRLLVAAAMSAARARAWQDYVQRQRVKGLPPTAVHVILARKLLRIAFALSKRDGATFLAPSYAS